MNLKHLTIGIFSLLILSCSSPKNITSTEQLTKESLHLYILMGQSNMAGRGKVEAIDTLTHPRVLMLNKEEHWLPAKDPMHFDKPVAGAGLGLTFGKILANENPAIRIGLIPTAVGGSSINSWFADSLYKQTNTYPYDDMIRRAKKAMETGTLKGIIWHQGESDSNSDQAISAYSEKFEAMVTALKTDLGLESVPIVMGEIGYFFYTKASHAEAMNGVINQIAKSNNCIGLVSAEGLTHKGDSTHFDSNSYHALGMRYATKMPDIQANCTVKLNK